MALRVKIMRCFLAKRDPINTRKSRSNARAKALEQSQQHKRALAKLSEEAKLGHAALSDQGQGLGL
jgi:hypothetical protein